MRGCCEGDAECTIVKNGRAELSGGEKGRDEGRKGALVRATNVGVVVD